MEFYSKKLAFTIQGKEAWIVCFLGWMWCIASDEDGDNGVWLNPSGVWCGSDGRCSTREAAEARAVQFADKPPRTFAEVNASAVEGW